MRDKQTNELLQHLMKCIAACENCATKCLEEDNVQMMKNCIRTDRDCADICALTARLISRGSDNLDGILEQCIAICKACEKECAQHDHSHCKKCAEACRECYIRCEEYVGAVA